MGYVESRDTQKKQSFEMFSARNHFAQFSVDIFRRLNCSIYRLVHMCKIIYINTIATEHRTLSFFHSTARVK